MIPWRAKEQLYFTLLRRLVAWYSWPYDSWRFRMVLTRNVANLQLFLSLSLSPSLRNKLSCHLSTVLNPSLAHRHKISAVFLPWCRTWVRTKLTLTLYSPNFFNRRQKRLWSMMRGTGRDRPYQYTLAWACGEAAWQDTTILRHFLPRQDRYNA